MEYLFQLINDKNICILSLLSGKENLDGTMKLSEASFTEWDNEEDEIYNNYSDEYKIQP